MKWFWKVRIYRPDGRYAVTQVETNRGDLHEIDTIQDFYFTLTGAKMLLEGMSETPFFSIEATASHPRKTFDILFKPRLDIKE